MGSGCEYEQEGRTMIDMTHLTKEVGRYKVLLEGLCDDWGILVIEFNINDVFTIKIRRNYALFQWANNRFTDLNQEVDVEKFLAGNSELYCEFSYQTVVKYESRGSGT
jgi:hypothetical protein